MAVDASKVKELREKTGAGILDTKKALDATNGDIDKAVEYLRENGIAKVAKKGNRIAAEGLTKALIKSNDAIIIELNSETDFVAKNKEFNELLDQITEALLKANPNDLKDALKVDINGDTVEELITNATATIGEKISLRRFKILNKESDESFATYSHMGGRISVLVKFKKVNEDLEKGISMHIAAEKPEYLHVEDIAKEKVEKEQKILLKEAVNEGKPQNIASKIAEGRLRKFFEQVVLLEQAYVMDSDKKIAEVVKEQNNEIEDFVRYEVGEGIEKAEINFADEVAAQVK